MTEQKTETEMTVAMLEKMLKGIEDKHKKVVNDINQLEQKINQFNQEHSNIKNQLVTDAVELQGQMKLLQDQIKMLSGKNGAPSPNGEKPH